MDKISPLPPESHIVILTGAGISAESGLKTFRDADGLWEGHAVEDVATPEAFLKNPALVYKFYNERRRGLLGADVKPNAAHEALAELQKQWPETNGGAVTLITQNIDDLHESGGSTDVIHMHGQLLKMFCKHCAFDLIGQYRSQEVHEVVTKYNVQEDFDAALACKDCGKTGGMRPDIVWFGEMPYHMDRIAEALNEVDLFLSIGTSGHVYPAAGFTAQALMNGAKTVELNMEPSVNAHNFHDSRYGPATKTVPDYVCALLEK